MGNEFSDPEMVMGAFNFIFICVLIAFGFLGLVSLGKSDDESPAPAPPPPTKPAIRDAVPQSGNSAGAGMGIISVISLIIGVLDYMK